MCLVIDGEKTLFLHNIIVWFLSLFSFHGKAVNKLAEIMNRKGPVKRGADTDVRRKEKENRKLHMELKSEREKLTQMMIKYQKEINEMQAVRSFCKNKHCSIFCKILLFIQTLR